MRISEGGSSSSAAAAEAARRAAEAARRAEEARRRAEEARRRAEEARRQAAEARKQAEAAKKAAAAAKKAAESSKKPDAKKCAAALEKKAQEAAKKQQAAEEQVALKAREAELRMREANAAAKAEKKPEPYSAKELTKNQLKPNEVTSAFDGASAARRDELARALGVDGRQKPAQIAKEVEADRQYERLAGDPRNRPALEQLGIKDGRDLVRLGDQLEAQLKGGAADPRLAKVEDKGALTKLLQAAGQTREGDAKKAMTNELFASLVAHGVPAAEAQKNYARLEQLGYQPADLAAAARLSANHGDFKKLVDSLSVLADPQKSAADKCAATIELVDVAGSKLLPPEKLEATLGKTLKGLPSAKAAITALSTLSNPDASALEKAKATFDLAKELKGYAGDLFPKVAEKLRHLDGPVRAAGAAMTLLDPKASLKDKALAGAQLAAELPDLKGGLRNLKDVFTRAGVQNPEQVIRQGEELAQLALRGVDPALVSGLSQQQLDRLASTAAKLDEESAKNLGKALQGLDAAGVQRFFKVTGGMSAEALTKALADPASAGHLAKTVGKLDDHAAEALAKIAKDMDGEGFKVLLKFADVAPADVLKTGLRTLSPILEKGGGKLLGKALSALDTIVGKLGVHLSADVAVKVFKSLAKIAPVAGAIPNVIDAAKYGKEALELQGKNKDLGFLAMVGAGLNSADAAFGIIADATGVGVLADVGGSIAFSVAELALDIGFSHEKAKLLENPSGYEAPGWVKAVNLVGAVTTAPAGIAALTSYYGVEGSAHLALWAVGQGGKLAEKAWDALKAIGGPAVKYVGPAIQKLEDLGEGGVEALKYIARAPGELGEEAVKAATRGLENLAQGGLDLARDALGGLGSVASALNPFD